MITYWASAEFDGDAGRHRVTRKFDTVEARDAWNPKPLAGQGWSDWETWETEGEETNAYRETPRFGG
jgi:hypothetical protein